MNTTPQRRAIRRAYRRAHQSHPNYSTTLILALGLPVTMLLITILLTGVYVALTAPHGADPHDYRGAMQRGNYACAAFGRLSHSYHNQRCD